MPKLVRLYILQVVVGFALSAVFVVALLWLNIGNLWHLVTASDVGLLAVFLLWLFNGIVFAGVQFAIAIMRMGEKEPEDRSGSSAPELVLARVQPPRGSNNLDRTVSRVT